MKRLRRSPSARSDRRSAGGMDLAAVRVIWTLRGNHISADRALMSATRLALVATIAGCVPHLVALRVPAVATVLRPQLLTDLSVALLWLGIGILIAALGSHLRYMMRLRASWLAMAARGL